MSRPFPLTQGLERKDARTLMIVVGVHALAYWGVLAAGELGHLSGEPTVFLLWCLSFVAVPLLTWPDLVEARHWSVVSWAGVTYAIAVPILVLGTLWYLKGRRRKRSRLL